MKSSWGLEDSLKDSGKASGSIDLPTGDVQKGELTPAMDIFSAGQFCRVSISIPKSHFGGCMIIDTEMSHFLW